MFMKDIFLKRRNLVLEKLNEIKGINCNTPHAILSIPPDVSYYFENQMEQQLLIVR